ncbi:MAG TPA: hypothetical protein VHE35_17060 [Kofleriaceae bacterium]|nr:hypothetical protein [Kofleriaceae bacterium]
MIFRTTIDSQARYVQAPGGCAPAAVEMACRDYGHPPGAIDKHLRERLETERHGGAYFHLVAAELRQIGIRAEHGSGPLDAALALRDQGRLVIGVRPSVMYTGAGQNAKHAVYVASNTQPADNMSVAFIPAIEIIDPEALAPERSTWTYELLSMAYAGEWILIRHP